MSWEVTVDERGRISLPVELRRELGLEVGDKLTILRTGDHLELELPRPEKIGTVDGTVFPTGAAEELRRQGIIVAWDSKRKEGELQRE